MDTVEAVLVEGGRVAVGEAGDRLQAERRKEVTTSVEIYVFMAQAPVS